MDAHNLLRTSGLFDHYFLWEMGLSDPYLEAVNLSFIFTWDDKETKDHAKVSTSPLFKRLSINNIELRDILTRNKMYDNTNTT